MINGSKYSVSKTPKIENKFKEINHISFALCILYIAPYLEMGKCEKFALIVRHYEAKIKQSDSSLV